MSNHNKSQVDASYVHLGQLAEITMGQSPDSSGYNTNQVGLPFLQGCAEFGRLSPTAKIYCNPPLRVSKPESILISVRAPVGTQNWGDVSYCIGRGLSAIKARQGIADTKFLSYAISHNIDFLHRRSQGSTFLAIGAKELRTFPVPNYDFNTQSKIRIVLQSVDHAIDKTEELISKYHKIKIGMMHDLFTRGVNSDGKLRPCRAQSPDLYKKTSIGWIPNDWSTIPFGNVINIIDPNPSHRYPNESEDGYPICSTENFYGSDGFDYSKSKKVSESVYQSQNNRCQFSSLDVIFARKGRLGLARRYGAEKKVFSHTVVIMKPLNDKVDPSWLLWLVRSNWFLDGILHEMNTNLGVPTLGVEFIKGINIPLCSVDEQIQINRALDKLSEKIHALEHELAKLERIKIGLLHDLLTGKATVTYQEGTEITHV
ncbi:TPA: restriction endonuclease subunit S [Klebsiella aerogenes]|nr:restriction endonuclease subunit S [Klebsiella aerogenes]